MNWATLYTTRRAGTADTRAAYDAVRNSFVRDYDRIIFSSAFRRLQNKTQVFPLPGAVFVHNRLTHSLEVSSIGRSLGKAVGEQIARSQGNNDIAFQDFYRYELPSVIAAACLAHDIGNPPFGHSGENAIRTFFNELDGEMRRVIEDNLTDNQRKDFEWFEGNSNALRVLTHSFNEDEPGGFRLTYTTLAAIIKYPSCSAEGFNKNSGLIATKKSGFFDSEIEAYERIAESMDIPRNENFSMVYCRHPFVYLTEAADDICYRIVDIEDAHRLNIITLAKLQELFLPFFEAEQDYYGIDYVRSKLAGIKDDNGKAQYIRARWIGLMIDKITEAFANHEQELLAGNLETDLLGCLPEKDRALIKNINDFSVQHIYNYRSVVEIEIAGYNVIGGLLKEFVGAVIDPSGSKAAKLLKLIPAQFEVKKGADNLYCNIQSVVDYIAGMTDLYAIDMFRKITGITIPEIK
jgi:dGTPase